MNFGIFNELLQKGVRITITILHSRHLLPQQISLLSSENPWHYERFVSNYM